MVKMKSTYRKTGLVVAVLALLVVMSAPTAMAAHEQISATWEDPHIKATARDFEFKNGKNYQFKYCEPNGGTCHSGAIWMADATTTSYTERFNVISSGATTGEWTVCLYKAGDSGNSNPTEQITSARVWTTVDVDVPIPEFATIAIPIVALLGLVAFYRRKQKK